MKQKKKNKIKNRNEKKSKLTRKQRAFLRRSSEELNTRLNFLLKEKD